MLVVFVWSYLGQKRQPALHVELDPVPFEGRLLLLLSILLQGFFHEEADMLCVVHRVLLLRAAVYVCGRGGGGVKKKSRRKSPGNQGGRWRGAQRGEKGHERGTCESVVTWRGVVWGGG